MRTGCKSSLARSDPEGATKTGVKGGRRGAGVVGPALRFAPNAPPFGLRRAALRTRPTKTGCPRSSEMRIVVPGAS